jgi:ribulose-phosphate 3-epimerase
MSVHPGFGGQAFIETTYLKIALLKELIAKKNASTLIEIDGGVTLINAKKIIAAGADVLVAGSSVFNTASPTQTILEFKKV